jgi:hypothetical protein
VKEIGNILGFLVMSGVMLYILGVYGNKFRLVRQSRRWPSTMGEIIQSKVVRESNHDGSYYSAKVVYRYSARGRVYEADTVQIGAGGNTGAKKKARRIVGRYPVGTQALVYFDPKQPDRACLERRGEAGWVLGVVAIVYPVLMLGVFVETFGIDPASVGSAGGGKRDAAAYVPDYSDHSYSGGRGIPYGLNALAQPVSLDLFEGRFVFVEYTAPWCSSAGAQAASFRNLTRRPHVAGREVVFLTVMTGGEEALTPSTRETALEWAQRYGLDPARVVAEGDSSRTVPQHALFSPSGQTLYRSEGRLTEAQMAALLARRIGQWHERYAAVASDR